MGLAAAERLASQGHQVTVFEAAGQVGGLSTWKDYGPFVWDRFYHVILPSDRSLIALLRRIGLEDQIRWRKSGTGYYVDGRIHPFDSTADFLRFPLLGPWSKARLAATILGCSRITDWRGLEEIPVEDFLVRWSGRPTFERFWKPLLLAKLGEHYRRVSAVFIWSYIRRLFSARDGAARKEELGFVHGGYRTVFQALLERIDAAGGTVRTGVRVESVSGGDEGGIEVIAEGEPSRWDKVLLTSPVGVARRIVDPGLLSPLEQSADVEYLGVACLALVTRAPLVSQYVVNLGDGSTPFTGVIGLSSLTGPEETGGLHLTYFPRYVLSTDPFLQRSDREIRDEFLAAALRMFPSLDPEDVVGAHVHRALRVQPLQVLGYSKLVPDVRTRHPDLYLLNSAQFVNNTLNNNEVAGAVERFFDRFGEDFAAPARPQRGAPTLVGAES